MKNESAEKILALSCWFLLLILEVRGVELILPCAWFLLLRLLGHLLLPFLFHKFLIQPSICVVELLLGISCDLLCDFRVLLLRNGCKVVYELDDLHLLHFHAIHVLDLLLTCLWLFGRVSLLLGRNDFCLGRRVLLPHLKLHLLIGFLGLVLRFSVELLNDGWLYSFRGSVSLLAGLLLSFIGAN